MFCERHDVKNDTLCSCVSSRIKKTVNVLSPEMLNEKKCLSRGRGRGRGQNLEIEAEAEAKFKEAEQKMYL